MGNLKVFALFVVSIFNVYFIGNILNVHFVGSILNVHLEIILTVLRPGNCDIMIVLVTI